MGGVGAKIAIFEPYNQVVKVGEGWVDLEPVLFTICWVANWVNILLDSNKQECLSLAVASTLV